MKPKIVLILLAAVGWSMSISSCNSGTTDPNAAATTQSSENTDGGQSAVADNDSEKDIVKVAVSSPDHTTLVNAIKAAEYADVLSNTGPFTVFAPTNEAFAQLPEGTLKDLLKPENQQTLRNILEYHVYVGVIKTEGMQDGQKLNEVNLDNVTLGVKDGKYSVNDAHILASIPASNGIIHVIDKVLLPPDKK